MGKNPRGFTLPSDLSSLARELGVQYGGSRGNSSAETPEGDLNNSRPLDYYLGRQVLTDLWPLQRAIGARVLSWNGGGGGRE